MTRREFRIVLPMIMPTSECCTGLGGVVKHAIKRWFIPMAVLGVATDTSFAEIDGDMPGLISTAQLEKWDYTWY